MAELQTAPIHKHTRTGNRFRPVPGSGRPLVVVLLAVLGLVSSCGAGDEPADARHALSSINTAPLEGPYYQDFLRFWTTMDEGYAYFIEKGIDWDALFDLYEPIAYDETDRASFALMIAGITTGAESATTARSGPLSRSERTSSSAATSRSRPSSSSPRA